MNRRLERCTQSRTVKQIPIIDAFAAEYDMEETEYDKNLKQAKESEDFIARAIESIKRDYRSAIMPSLKNINKTHTEIPYIEHCLTAPHHWYGGVLEQKR